MREELWQKHKGLATMGFSGDESRSASGRCAGRGWLVVPLAAGRAGAAGTRQFNSGRGARWSCERVVMSPR